MTLSSAFPVVVWDGDVVYRQLWAEISDDKFPTHFICRRVCLWPNLKRDSVVLSNIDDRLRLSVEGQPLYALLRLFNVELPKGGAWEK